MSANELICSRCQDDVEVEDLDQWPWCITCDDYVTEADWDAWRRDDIDRMTQMVVDARKERRRVAALPLDKRAPHYRRRYAGGATNE
jgi:hypothetical protein